MRAPFPVMLGQPASKYALSPSSRFETWRLMLSRVQVIQIYVSTS